MESGEAARKAKYLEWQDNEWDLSWLVAFEDGAEDSDLRLFVRKPQISTGFVTRLFNYGSLYHVYSDDFIALIQSLEKNVLTEPEDTESWSNLGCLLFDAGETIRASHCFDTAVRYDRRDARLWHNAGEHLHLKHTFVALDES
jgi:tetratricopeptide (TPR) repeat protein